MAGDWKDLPWLDRLLELTDLTEDERAVAGYYILALPEADRELAVPKASKAAALRFVRARLDLERQAREAAVPAVPGPSGGIIKDKHIDRLAQLCAPSVFGLAWPEFQELKDPLFACPRGPHTQKTWPALLFKPFAKFCGLVNSVEVDHALCCITRKLIAAMSASYLNTTSAKVQDFLRAAFGRDDPGKARGMEQKRAVLLRENLLALLQQANYAPKVRRYVKTLEPASMSNESKAQTDGTFRLGDVCQPVIIEVNEDIGQGDSHPLMQLLAYYAKVVVDKRQTRAIVETYFLAIGIVCFGNHLEVHALCLADKAASQLLAAVELSNLDGGHPDHMEHVARVLKATVLTLEKVLACMELYMEDNIPDSNVRERDPELRACVPYVLREGREGRPREFTRVERLDSDFSRLFLCTDKEGKKFVAKVLVGSRPYAADLHEELAAKELAPCLLQHEVFLQGFAIVVMDYLDPAEGWVRLDHVDADSGLDAGALSKAGRDALAGLQSCLGGDAVHGDLRRRNMFARRLSSEKVQLVFVDFDWGGRQGQVKYPAFISDAIQWPETEPACKPIMQAHDTQLFNETLDLVIAGLNPVPADVSQPASDAARPTLKRKDPGGAIDSSLSNKQHQGASG